MSSKIDIINTCYDIYLRKLNIYLTDRNWIRFFFKPNSFLELIINPVKKNIVLSLVNKVKLIDQIIDKNSYLEHHNLNILVNKVKTGYIISYEKQKIKIKTQRIIDFLEVSFWIDVDIYNQDSQPIKFKKQQIEFITKKEPKSKNKYIVKKENSLHETLQNLSVENKKIETSLNQTLQNLSVENKKIEICLQKETPKICLQKQIPLNHINIKKTLSFAITCMNRFSQIKKTLQINLKHNQDINLISEFVVTDFGTPGLKQFIYENFYPELKLGYLKYFYDDSLKKWHASKAKNKSHQNCHGKYITNLDCDNFIGPQGGRHILKFYEKMGENLLLHQWSGISKDGTYGRITCRKSNFLFLGGYDESFLPMGYQDHDFIMRYVMYYRNNNYFCYNYFPDMGPFRKYCQAIENDKVASLQNTDWFGKMKWQEMNEINKIKSKNNIKKGIFRVNQVYYKNNVM